MRGERERSERGEERKRIQRGRREGESIRKVIMRRDEWNEGSQRKAQTLPHYNIRELDKINRQCKHEEIVSSN